MKKSIAVLLSVTMLCTSVFLSGCQSKAEREYEQARNVAREMEKNAEDARRELEELNRMIDDYNEAVERLK